MKRRLTFLIGTGILAAHLLSAQPSITILSPESNARWSYNFTYPIKWAVSGVDSLRIEYSTTGPEGPWALITSGIPSSQPNSTPYFGAHEKNELDRFARTGCYYWSVPGIFPPPVPPDSCHIRLSDKSNPSVFNIKRFSIRGYSSWTVQVSEVDVPLYAAYAVSNSPPYSGVGWAGGKNGVILRTIDNGIHWVVSGMLGEDVHTITALYSTYAIVGSVSASGKARISITTNGGNSWNVVDTTTTVWRHLRLFDATDGYAFGDPVGGFWVLKRTVDGGITWSDFPVRLSASAGEEGRYNAMVWTDVNRGWFGTNYSTIYRTTDGGTSWLGATLQPSSSSITSLYFNSTSGSFGLAGREDGSIYRTTDGGVTWNQVSTALPSAVVGIGRLTWPYECWAASGQDVYRSQDSGRTWTTNHYEAYTGTVQLHHMSLSGQSSFGYGWAVGNSGEIIGFRRMITDVEPAPPVLPTAHALFQNYPNPFNPTTTIRFSLPSTGTTQAEGRVGVGSHVTLKVFDILGREVATVVNEEMRPGGYERTFDASAHSSGVYFYRLQAGSFTSTRKLLILR